MKRVLIIGDLHVGSVWGMSPPKFLRKHGNAVEYNDIQKHLWKNWNKFLKKIKRRKIDTLILNGDIIDGPAYRDRGRCLMSPDMEDQVVNAATVGEELIEKGGFSEEFVMSGTDYHTSIQQDNEAQLAKYIDAEYVGLGPFDFECENININIGHGTGSTYWYRGTKMDKIGFSMQLNIAGIGLYDSRHIVRSHLHFRGALEYEHQSIYICPCWQAQTDYMRKKDPLKHVPNIGSLELTVKGDKVEHRYYSFPHPPRPKQYIRGHYLKKRAKIGNPVLQPEKKTVSIKEHKNVFEPNKNKASLNSHKDPLSP